jgi:methionyl-tRNA formyltransferase
LTILRLVMMGTGSFAEPTFKAILGGPHTVVGLVTQPDRPSGQERGSTRQAERGMIEIAHEHQLPVLQPASINTPEGVAGLRDLEPDLLVVAAYGQILSNDVLSVPPHGGINVHASLLPRYRGAAPVAWAIYHGEDRTGVTVIKMSVRLDAGDMVAQEAIAILPDETAGQLEARLAILGARLAFQIIEQIAAGTERGTKQDASQATKAPKLTKEHGVIDWSRPARDVVNHIRAMQPWPTAYTYFKRAGQAPVRLIVYKARVHDGANSSDTSPGQVIVGPVESGRLVVRTGQGSAVEILELQPAGKRRMSSAEFLRGHRPHPGDLFGPEPQ